MSKCACQLRERDSYFRHRDGVLIFSKTFNRIVRVSLHLQCNTRRRSLARVSRIYRRDSCLHEPIDFDNVRMLRNQFSQNLEFVLQLRKRRAFSRFVHWLSNNLIDAVSRAARSRPDFAATALLELLSNWNNINLSITIHFFSRSSFDLLGKRILIIAWHFSNIIVCVCVFVCLFVCLCWGEGG